MVMVAPASEELDYSQFGGMLVKESVRRFFRAQRLKQEEEERKRNDAKVKMFRKAMPRTKRADRPMMWRWSEILKLLAAKPRSTRQISEQLQVSSKTISRDLDYMRDMGIAPIDTYGPGTGQGFRLTGPAFLMSGEKIQPCYV